MSLSMKTAYLQDVTIEGHAAINTETECVDCDMGQMGASAIDGWVSQAGGVAMDESSLAINGKRGVAMDGSGVATNGRRGVATDGSDIATDGGGWDRRYNRTLQYFMV